MIFIKEAAQGQHCRIWRPKKEVVCDGNIKTRYGTYTEIAAPIGPMANSCALSGRGCEEDDLCPQCPSN